MEYGVGTANDFVKLLESEKIGNAIRGKLRDYRDNPSDFTSTANYAFSIASNKGIDVFIIPGNSYGQSVYRISLSDSSEEIHKQTAMKPRKGFTYAKVTKEGEVFRMVWE